eukprot:6669843-Alexandrium_andersonii.AAC.1
MLADGASRVAVAAGASEDVPSPPAWQPAAAELARRSFDPLAGAAHQDPCPLCGVGEFSSEHLLVWCPAV